MASFGLTRMVISGNHRGNYLSLCLSSLVDISEKCKTTVKITQCRTVLLSARSARCLEFSKLTQANLCLLSSPKKVTLPLSFFFSQIYNLDSSLSVRNMSSSICGGQNSPNLSIYALNQPEPTTNWTDWKFVLSTGAIKTPPRRSRSIVYSTHWKHV